MTVKEYDSAEKRIAEGVAIMRGLLGLNPPTMQDIIAPTDHLKAMEWIGESISYLNTELLGLRENAFHAKMSDCYGAGSEEDRYNSEIYSLEKALKENGIEIHGDKQ